ncbi:minor tail protein [Stenotrophomonas phage Piffle]|uniref:Minor tail protein n=1 Tax=Stenotrophomonas phage Piffle TaxID=2859656 RepID=A0AAE7WLY3_9CAUD|nr:minor tail protein [Stenotrophomonas phage Piffle]QYW01912.1 minor tail protein [Stenotrophomonas phage Piffle]
MCTQPTLNFKRGSTFAFVFSVPAEVPDGFFRNWVPKAQLRKARTDTSRGLVADLDCFWDNDVKARLIHVRQLVTDDWPLGEMELDIRLESVNRETIQTSTITIKIERGITHG